MALQTKQLKLLKLFKNNSNIKFIDKENGGHGSGINAGLKICEGLYFKCVDSDDWIDFDAYKN